MAKKDKKFKTGAVSFEFSKDYPYMTSLETDDKGKFTGKAIPKVGNQFKAGDQKRLRYDLAGKLAANGYGNILDSKNRKVNTKEAISSK